jgi:hypothetical protein
VFDGLFPEPYNSSILKLLFLCAHWHGLAKLCSHTDPTLDIFDDVTSKTGATFRHFANNICVDFDTQELAREAGQRKRREAKRKSRTPQDVTPNTWPMPVYGHLPDTSTPLTSANGTLDALPAPPARNPASLGTTTLPTAVGSTPQALPTSGPREEMTPPSPPGAQQHPATSTFPKFSNTAGTSSRKKIFTLNTYKYHACGDYPNTIRCYGTTDSYSTEIVSYPLSCILFSFTPCL